MTCFEHNVQPRYVSVKRGYRARGKANEGETPATWEIPVYLGYGVLILGKPLIIKKYIFLEFL